MEYKLEMVIGEDHQRRGVAFLISKEKKDKKITAKNAFNKLNKNAKDTLKIRFEYWQSGKIHNKYFHGWDHSEFQGRYAKCFVFKLGENRFYGFLHNPKERNSRYQLCVLVVYAEKKEKDTYEPDLKHVEEIRNILDVQKAVRDFFRGKS